jgi:hypothetical protein
MQNADKRFLAKRQRREEFKNDLYDLTANDAKIVNKIKTFVTLMFFSGLMDCRFGMPGMQEISRKDAKARRIEK